MIDFQSPATARCSSCLTAIPRHTRVLPAGEGRGEGELCHRGHQSASSFPNGRAGARPCHLSRLPVHFKSVSICVHLLATFHVVAKKARKPFQGFSSFCKPSQAVFLNNFLIRPPQILLHAISTYLKLFKLIKGSPHPTPLFGSHASGPFQPIATWHRPPPPGLPRTARWLLGPLGRSSPVKQVSRKKRLFIFYGRRERLPPAFQSSPSSTFHSPPLLPVSAGLCQPPPHPFLFGSPASGLFRPIATCYSANAPGSSPVTFLRCLFFIEMGGFPRMFPSYFD